MQLVGGDDALTYGAEDPRDLPERGEPAPWQIRIGRSTRRGRGTLGAMGWTRAMCASAVLAAERRPTGGDEPCLTSGIRTARVANVRRVVVVGQPGTFNARVSLSDLRIAQALADVNFRISVATSSGSSNIAVWPHPGSSRSSAFGSTARNRSA
jgi:hypothetical protein